MTVLWLSKDESQRYVCDLVFVVAEDEYKTEVSLPEFAAKHLGRDFKVSFVFETPSKKYDLPGVEIVKDADVLLISARRRPGFALAHDSKVDNEARRT